MKARLTHARSALAVIGCMQATPRTEEQKMGKFLDIVAKIALGLIFVGILVVAIWGMAVAPQ